jgi:hypothetical protein
MILLVGAILFVGGIACACPLGERLSQRLAAEPTDTPAPTKTPRPTFTATPDWTPTPSITPTPTNTLIPTDTPTPIPTDTLTPVPATATFTPAPPTATFTPAPPTATFTPAPPTATPAPDFPFYVAEQSNREFTHTNNHNIWVIIEILDPSGVPLGGYRVVGDSSTGLHVVSEESCWDFCKHTPPGGYAKVGNVTFEPGGFIDGTWSLYLVDGGGSQVSPVVTLSYNSDPGQWVWDHILFKRK